MIYSKEGVVSMTGTAHEIIADASVALYEINEKFTESFGEETAKKLMEKITLLSQMSEYELSEQIKKHSESISLKEYEEKEKREKIHRILDLVLDINSFERRSVEITGDKPTAFLYFHGHASSLNVSIHENGWVPYACPTYQRELYLNEEKPELDEVIEMLEKIKDGTHTKS